jgi:hypothetical protein
VVATGAGAGSRVSLGTAVFGGMLAATVIGTLLIPVMYYAVQGVRERMKGAPRAAADGPPDGARTGRPGGGGVRGARSESGAGS